MIKNYFIGCPIWSNKDWVGNFFTTKAKPKDFLKEYSNVLNTVEGNSTFYGLPKIETFLKWKEESQSNFKFSFKFPQSISHNRRLVGTEQETTRFLRTVEVLEDKLGILFLQLPPFFDKSNFTTLESFLRRLPKSFTFAIEVRHKDFFDESENEIRFNELLEELGINRVMFDTQTLHSIRSNEISVLEAQRKKPKVVERIVSTAENPFLRFVGYNEVEPNLPRLNYLANFVAKWIDEGKKPFIFMHSPTDLFAPQICKEFHKILQSKVKINSVGEFPNWNRSNEPEQLNLF
ncbi:MAG: DUF72 domain-containing protein [Calditrichaeota bacterium]|nr:MAG: DUF72 domain-containing protein [Calditrichota bacterium]